MQNTMLDTVVSSNSQELSFDFNAEHNGEHCIASLDPKDRGTECQFRFTRALLCTLLGVKSENTITNHIDALSPTPIDSTCSRLSNNSHTNYSEFPDSSNHAEL